MARIALGVEYDGTDFVGWQAQGEARSVQSVLEEAAGRVADEPLTLHAAGRTDAGVHAAGQVVHFDTRAERSPRQWLLGINSNLPMDVSVAWARPVPESFDARRSALSRRYRYWILQRDARSALTERRAWWITDRLDGAAMIEAATCLLGEHDFSAFRASGCQSTTPWRCLQSIRIAGRDGLMALDFCANAFVYHMVRNLVGLLVEIGRGRRDASSARLVLEGRDRKASAATAPAQGLTLLGVAYSEDFDLPGVPADELSALVAP